MSNKTKQQAQPATQFENLISRLEQIRREFYHHIHDSDDIDQSTFENAINEAQTVIGSCMAQSLVDRIRQGNTAGN